RDRSGLSAVPILCATAFDLREPPRRSANNRPVSAGPVGTRTRDHRKRALAAVARRADRPDHGLQETDGCPGKGGGAIVDISFQPRFVSTLTNFAGHASAKYQRTRPRAFRHGARLADPARSTAPPTRPEPGQMAHADASFAGRK